MPSRSVRKTLGEWKHARPAVRWAAFAAILMLGACAPGPLSGKSQSAESPHTAPVFVSRTTSVPLSAPQVALRADSAMTAPLEVTFLAGPLAGGRADWQFSDGGNASGGSVTHVFYRPGHYDVRATMNVDGHEYRATLPLDLRSGGPEQVVAVLLQDAGSVALSPEGSVVYAPYKAHFTLDARATADARQPLTAGIHSLQVSVTAPSGTLGRSYSFRSRAGLGAGEAATRQQYESEVLQLTNRARVGGWNCQRQAYGGPPLPPLRADPALLEAARAQSVGMAVNGYFDHRSPVDGSLPDARVRASGYPALSDAENIAAGQPTPEAVMNAWLKSPGHCPNIMGDYDDIGAAYVHQDGSPMGDYWTQVFGRKRK